MKKFRRISWALLALGACVAGWWLLREGDRETALRFAWHAGKQYVYQVEHEVQSDVTLEIASAQGKVQTDRMSGKGKIAGELRVTCVERDGDDAWLKIAFASLHTTELEVMGQTILSDAAKDSAALTSAAALVRMGADGRIAELRFSDKDSPLARSYLQTLIGDVQVILGEGQRWSAEETSQVGTSTVVYQIDSRAGARTTLSKSRTEYQALAAVTGGLSDKHQTIEGMTHVVLGDGAIASFEGREKLAVDSPEGANLLHQVMSVKLELLRVDDLAQMAASSTRAQSLAEMLQSHAEKRVLGQIKVSESAERRATEQQAAGMTTEQVVADLRTFGNGGTMPHHNRWLWRATGALTLDPEGCALLAPLFRDPGATAAGRALIADLLVTVDHGEAQAVLVELLSDPAAQAQPDFVDLLQRVGRFSSPSPETVALVQGLLARSGPSGDTRDVHLASAHTLGTLADKLSKSGHAEEASPLVHELITRLSAAPDKRARQAFVSGLGNATAPESEPVLAEAAQDNDPGVRQAAVNGLRRLQSPSATEAILARVSDPDDFVQAQAIRALNDKQISREQLLGIQSKLAAGEIRKGNVDVLSQLLLPLLRDADRAEVSRSILEELLRLDLPARLRYQLRQAMTEARIE